MYFGFEKCKIFCIFAQPCDVSIVSSSLGGKEVSCECVLI